MNNILANKIAATFAGVVLSLTTIQVQSAQAVSALWDLTFFNDSDQQVGTGEFSSDPEKIETIGNIGRPPTTITVSGVLDTFSAKVGQMEWGQKDLGERKLWWNLNSPQATEGQSIRSRFGTFRESNWQLKENNNVQESPFSSLILSGSSTESLGTGIWTQDLLVIPEDPFVPIDYNKRLITKGTWTASERNTKSVPEASLVLPLLGFGAIVLSRKLSRLAS